MKKVAVLLAPGFEEAEAIITIDILRRLNIAVETLACADSRAVVSYHAIPMVADSTLSERQATLFDAIVLPGGPHGSVNLAASNDVVQFVKAHDAAGKLICPICSAAMSARAISINRCAMASMLMRPSLKMATSSAAKGWGTLSTSLLRLPHACWVMKQPLAITLIISTTAGKRFLRPRPAAGYKDKLADVMDYPAFTFAICLTKAANFMVKFAEFMYGITVIQPCDAALLWRINFPLKLFPAQMSI